MYTVLMKLLYMKGLDLCTFGYLKININNSITFFAFLLFNVGMGNYLLVVVVSVFSYVSNKNGLV